MDNRDGEADQNNARRELEAIRASLTTPQTPNPDIATEINRLKAAKVKLDEVNLALADLPDGDDSAADAVVSLKNRLEAADKELFRAVRDLITPPDYQHTLDQADAGRRFLFSYPTAATHTPAHPQQALDWSLDTGEVATTDSFSQIVSRLRLLMFFNVSARYCLSWVQVLVQDIDQGSSEDVAVLTETLHATWSTRDQHTDQTEALLTARVIELIIRSSNRLGLGRVYDLDLMVEWRTRYSDIQSLLVAAYSMWFWGLFSPQQAPTMPQVLMTLNQDVTVQTEQIDEHGTRKLFANVLSDVSSCLLVDGNTLYLFEESSIELMSRRRLLVFPDRNGNQVESFVTNEEFVRLNPLIQRYMPRLWGRGRS